MPQSVELKQNSNHVRYRRATTLLRESEEKYRGLYESIKDGILRTDMAGNILEINQAYADMLGYTKAEIKKLTFQQLTPAKWHQTEREIIEKQILKKGYSDEYEKEYIRKDGTIIPIFIRVWLIKDEKGKPKGLWGIVRDITRQKRMEEELRALSLVDDLTGLYNRRGFATLAGQQLRVVKRTKEKSLLFFADIDRMKWINDTFGHQEGDRALVKTAAILKKTFRDSDIVARYGGDEFVILAVDVNGTDPQILASRLEETLGKVGVYGQKYKLSLSVGVAHCGPDRIYPVDELIAKADVNMYEQKRKKNLAGLI